MSCMVEMLLDNMAINCVFLNILQPEFRISKHCFLVDYQTNFDCRNNLMELVIIYFIFGLSYFNNDWE